MTMKSRMSVVRGQATYEFVAESSSVLETLEALAAAEQWVFNSPNRLSKLDEADKLRAAQPGDTVQMRTR